MVTYCLIFGEAGPGWSWQKVQRRLHAAGHAVWTPVLPGVRALSARTPPTIPDSSCLPADTQYLLDLLAGKWLAEEDPVEAEGLAEELARGVVLVGHSYAGLVITGAAHRTTARLTHLVYLDALIPSEPPAWLTDPNPAALPRTYIYCSDKSADDPCARFAAWARSAPGWQYRELATGHRPMTTAPQELANLLLELT